MNLLGAVSRLPAPLQHLVIGLLATSLAWGGSEGVPWLRDEQGITAVLAPLVGLVITWATPFVTDYGTGSSARRALEGEPGKEQGR
jgi:hypothetical protein